MLNISNHKFSLYLKFIYRNLILLYQIILLLQLFPHNTKHKRKTSKQLTKSTLNNKTALYTENRIQMKYPI